MDIENGNGKMVLPSKALSKWDRSDHGPLQCCNFDTKGRPELLQTTVRSPRNLTEVAREIRTSDAPRAPEHPRISARSAQ